MYAYVDETGNSGSNLFDEEQPDFFTGALVTKANFDLVWGSSVTRVASDVGAASLHASVLGRHKVEQAAPSVLRILKKVDARFFVSRVEKRYLLATKVFDIFFDSGENPAAQWTAYNIRLLRINLAFRVAMLLTDEIARDFWAMLMARNEKEARALLPGICTALLENVDELPDQRTIEVVTQTLEWARDHPEALDIFIAGRQAKNGHMPNMVAFANLLDGLEKFSKTWNRPLRRIVHDRQSQFEGSLAEWHRMFSTASDEPIHRPGETIVFQKVAGSSFEISASDQSAGIQVADMALWLFRQFLLGRSLGPESSRLLRYVLDKGWSHDFSFRGVGEVLEKEWAEFMAIDIPQSQLSKGKELSTNLEKQRLENMSLYEQDGLMPYQRQMKQAFGARRGDAKPGLLPKTK